LLLVAALVLAGCVPRGAVTCPKPLGSGRAAYLFFGRSQAQGGEVSRRHWRQFVRTAIIPEFPKGFTVLSGRGYWREPGHAGFEASKVVVIVLPGRPDDLARLAAIRSAYKRRFQQQSVLEWIEAGCAGF
jgi:hypothetical protein